MAEEEVKDPKELKQKEDTTRVTSVHSVAANLEGTDCLIQIYGRHLGRKYEMYEPLITIGRDPHNTVVLDSDSVSRRHAAIEMSDSGRLLRDLDSTNGTYLNDIQVRSAILGNGDLVKIGDTILKYLAGANVESLYHEEIYRMTIHDGLTQIANKRFLVDYLEREFARAKRYHRPLSVLLFDIDHFKDINDQFGHLTGDYVLRELAGLLRDRIRKEELFARYGGEEFVIVLPESDQEAALRFGEIVRQMIESHQYEFEGQPIKVTVSVGVGTMSDGMEADADLVKAADDAMYRAKRDGRNRVSG